MKTLDEIGIKQGTNKSSLEHDYLRIYEKYFESIRKSSVVLLEIGVQGGRSMRTWEKYFYNKESRFYGIEVNKDYKYKNKRTKTFIGKQEDREFLEKIIKKINRTFDIIIDDGGHTMQQQQTSLGFLFPFLKSNGIYVIEDIHTSLSRKFNPTNTQHTTLSMIKGFTDNHTIESDFMLDDERQYLCSNIKECRLYGDKICFISKV